MAETKNLGKYWMYFGLSVLACLAVLVFLPEWFWVTLPFICTYFVQAKDWM